MVQHNVSTGKYFVDGEEVSKQQYDAELSKIVEQNVLADEIFHGEKTIDDCPPEWQKEVLLMVDIRKEDADPDMDESEVFDILMGGAV